MIRLVLAASVLALAACQPAAETPASADVAPPSTPAPEMSDQTPPAPSAAQAAGCAASLQLSWPSDLTADATVTGPSCEKAAVLLVVRDKAQNPALVWASQTAYVFGLYDKTDAASMKDGLREWLDQGPGPVETSSTLPAWKAGAEGPGDPTAEFPFHAEEWVDREYYEDTRNANLPTFAFPQGHESTAVFVLRDGQLEQVGVQQFPG
jgi:hypothetical protein